VIVVHPRYTLLVEMVVVLLLDIIIFMILGIESKYKGNLSLFGFSNMGLVFIYPMLACLKNLHSYGIVLVILLYLFACIFHSIHWNRKNVFSPSYFLYASISIVACFSFNFLLWTYVGQTKQKKGGKVKGKL
jgi:hypothetical protein